jgi:hypothetical protein
MAWASVIVVVVVDHGIVDHSGTVDDFDLGAVMSIRSIVVEYVSVVDASIRDKYPVSGWNIDPYID